MIFLFLGFSFLIFWSFYQAREKLELTFLNVQKKWVQEKNRSFAKRFLICFGLTTLSESPHRVRLTGIALMGLDRQSKNNWDRQWSLILICMSSFSVLLWTGILSMVFQTPAGFFLLAGLMAILMPKKWTSLVAFLWFLFFLGLFMHSVENSLRMSSFLGQEPFYQELSFLLADNRFISVLSWLLISLVVTFFIPFEGWSWIFCMLGISLGILGLSVALGFVIGESLGSSLVFLRVVSKTAKGFRNISLQYFLVMFLAAVIFVFSFGFFRAETFELSSLGAGPLSERIGWFLICALAWSGFSTVFSMVWGHFKALTPQQGSMSVESVQKWQANGGILPTFVQELFSLSQK